MIVRQVLLSLLSELGKDASTAKTPDPMHLHDRALYISSEDATLLMIETAE